MVFIFALFYNSVIKTLVDMDMKSILYKILFTKYCVLKIPQPSQGTNLTHSLPKILRNFVHF